MPRPCISIITVCYNAASIIEATICSVINQAYSNFEYIIIDGASKDGTPEIVRKYQRNSHLKWFSSEKDNGIYDAMNRGIAHAEGDWVCFMNAGDSFASDHVLEDVFGQNNIDNRIKVILGNNINILKTGEYVNKPSSIDYIKRGMICCHQATFTRLDPAWPWRFDPRYRIAGDYYLFHTIYNEFGAEAFLTIDIVISRYDCTDGMSLKNQRAAKKEYLMIQKEYSHFWWWNELRRYLFAK